MNIKEFRLLQKLMAMTTSPVDGEALMAIRQANRLLGEASLTWEKVFAKTVTVVAEVEADPEPKVNDPDAARIDSLFATIEDRELPDGLDKFVESLQEQWEKNRSLSPKQTAALEKIANRGER